MTTSTTMFIKQDNFYIKVGTKNSEVGTKKLEVEK